MRRAARAGAWGFATILLATMSPEAARGADPDDPTHCPGVIATGPASYRLTADLEACSVAPTSPLPPITIDLDGHTWSNSFVSLTNDGSRLTNGTFDASTVWISGSLDHVTIRNGHSFTVEAFGLLTVEDSTFESNEIGLSAYFGSATVQDSVFRDNDLGVVIGRGSGSVVEKNKFEDNRQGLLLWDEDTFGSDDVVVQKNHFLGNGVGIRVTAQVAVARAQIDGNQVDENDGAGISVDVFCFSGFPCGGQGGLVEGNHLRRNGFVVATPGDGDGIRVRGQDDDLQPVDPTWITLARNQADRNADLGIDAPGVSDGGKNRAKFNGDPQQCVGVDCGGPAGKHGAKKKSKGGAGTQGAARAAAQAAARGAPLSSLLVGLPRH